MGKRPTISTITGKRGSGGKTATLSADGAAAADWKDDMYKKYSTLLLKRKSRGDNNLHHGSSSTLTGGSKSSSTSSSSSIPSPVDDNWIKDFHTRYNPIINSRATINTMDTLNETAFSSAPDLTSTPVNLKIRPLNSNNNNGKAVDKKPLLMDMSQLSEEENLTGVKIYENISTNFMGNSSSDDSLAMQELNQTYEIVSATGDNRVLAQLHFRPRTLDFVDH